MTREQERRARQDQRFVSKETQTAAKYLRRMNELPGAPDSIQPFLNTLERIYVQMKGIATGRKTIGTYCVMAPQELIYAAGAVPVKLCSGNYTAFFVGDSIVPRDACPLLIEEMGGIVAGDETCMGERGLYDPPVITDNSFDGMVRALANRSLRPCPCPTFADNTQRIYRLKQLIRDGQIQGVIYHVLRGCLVYDFEYRRIEEELGKLGIPVIRLESDYNEEDVEQLRIRIEAFIELIKLRQAPETRRAARRDFA